jgi:hypothetical protein
MTRFLSFLLLVSLATGSQANPPGQQAEVDAAKAAIKTFAGALQTELKSAMQAGGPVAAISVCNTRALPIAEQVSAEQGMELSRVSLKNRNPGNAPNAWQKAVLEQFETRKAAGEDVNSLGWSETVDTGAGREFRFMKAIPTGGLCLACHGGTLSPEVQQKLAELYPDDKATGFIEGDIRGAFVVTRPLAD